MIPKAVACPVVYAAEEPAEKYKHASLTAQYLYL